MEVVLKVELNGKAKKKGVTEDDFDEESVSQGQEHEKEHTDDKEAAKQIALDHLAENAGYYDDLEEMEQKNKDEVEKAKFARPHYRKHGKGKNEKEVRVRGYTSPKDFDGLDASAVYEMAKSAVLDGERDLYRACREELERRDFMAKAAQGITGLQSKYGTFVDGGGGHGAVSGGAEAQGKPAVDARAAFEAMHGTDTTGEVHGEPDDPDEADGENGSDECSSVDEEVMLSMKRDIIKELSKAMRAEVARQVKKAILTKPSEEKGKKSKKSKPNPKGKVGSNSKGKSYQYDPKAAPLGGVPPGGIVEEQKPMKPQDVPAPAKMEPKKLADLLQTSVETLTTLAHKYNERKFVAYFTSHASSLIAKYEIPHEYWAELHHTLLNDSAASVAQKSANAKKQFTVDASVYEKGSELYNVARDLKKAKVVNAVRLEEFLLANYDLTSSEAKREAGKFLKSLVKDGAIHMR